LQIDSGDGTRDNDHGLMVACGGMGVACRSVPCGGGGGGRIRAVCATDSSYLGSVGATLLAATFLPRAVRDANAPLDGSVGAPLVTAAFPLRAVHDANASYCLVLVRILRLNYYE